MSPKVHTAQGLIGGICLYPFIGFYNCLAFAASVVLIDIDHIFEYYLDTKRLDLKGFFHYHDILFCNIKNKNFLGLNIFHTIEFYIFIFILAYFYFSIFYWILLGCIFHHIFDQIQLINKKNFFARAFSVIEYLIRKKSGKYLTSIHQLTKF